MRHGARALAAATALVAIALAGCTSGGGSTPSTPAPSTPATTASSSPTPSPSSSPSLSGFESDPAVQAFRKWAYYGARAVNTGHYTSATLNSLMGSYARKHIKQVFGGEVGYYYPGPLPFQPVSVKTVDATHHNINGCAVVGGWSENPKTRKPAEKYEVAGAQAQMAVQSGKWVLTLFRITDSVRCTGVTVKTQTW